MESLTYLKNIKLAPKKMRMMLDTVKKLEPATALDYLMYSPTKEAKIYYKAIHSAIHNAKQTLKVNADVLQFKLFTIEEGRALRRYKSGARGSVRPIKRRYSHIKIILIENPNQKVDSKKATKKELPVATSMKAPVSKGIKKEKKVVKERKVVKKDSVESESNK